ncbi:MAG: TetR/AcrR family transcriptional regulator [Coriobacteriia bacterium]|nr:TetR/AcrR family transcriptional regulator [Coriobacteriia bacterium]
MTTPEPSDQPKRRRGRPRKGEGDRAFREESILAVALDLFAEQGYQKTSMTQIARKVGINQSSLYYHFPSKEDLLNKIYNFRGVRKEFTRLGRLDVSNTLKLHLLVVYDVVAKCDLPFDFYEFESVATDNPDAFEELFCAYRELYQNLVTTMEAGIATGEFLPCDTEELAVSVLSINEGLQHHYHAKLRGQLILESAGYSARNLPPEDIGFMSSSSILSRICPTRPDFEQLRKEARSFAPLA